MNVLLLTSFCFYHSFFYSYQLINSSFLLVALYHMGVSVYFFESLCSLLKAVPRICGASEHVTRVLTHNKLPHTPFLREYLDSLVCRLGKH